MAFFRYLVPVAASSSLRLRAEGRHPLLPHCLLPFAFLLPTSANTFSVKPITLNSNDAVAAWLFARGGFARKQHHSHCNRGRGCGGGCASGRGGDCLGSVSAKCLLRYADRCGDIVGRAG